MSSRKAGVIAIAFLCCLMLFTFVQAQSESPLPLPLDANREAAQDRAGIELLTNTSFEIDADGDKLPDGWKSEKTDLDKPDQQKCNKPEKVFAYTGECAFQFKGNTGELRSKITQTLSDLTEIVDAGTLTLSAYVDPKSGVPTSKIASGKVKFSDGSVTKLKLNLPEASDAGYVLLTDSKTVSIPAGTFITKAKVDFRYEETDGKYWVDDVSLTVITIGTPTSRPTDGPSATPTIDAIATLTHTPTITPTATPTETFTIDQLIASDGAEQDNFGNAVSMSANGTTALIASRNDAVEGNSNQGSAYIFVRSGGIWTQQQKLIADDGAAMDAFGWSVSLSADGNTAVVGATLDNVDGTSDQGSAYVFVRSGSTWTQQAQLVANDGAANDNFGFTVSVSGDGNTVLIGAWRDDVGANSDQGSAYVFVRSGSTWTQQQKLVADDGAAGDNFSSSVSISADGNTALAGANSDAVGANGYQGSAYVFVRSGSTWTQQQKLVADDGASQDIFGSAVSLSANGNTALIGSPFNDVDAVGDQGSAYVFIRSGSTWTQQSKLVASDGAATDRLGNATSLSADGNIALVGASSDDIGANAVQGSAYLFMWNGSAWTQQQLVAADGAAQDVFGVSVSMSGDGRAALVGAYVDTVGTTAAQGSAWVFPIP